MKIDIDIIKNIVTYNYELHGNTSLTFSGMQSVNEATENDLVWFKPGIADAVNMLESTNARGVICDKALFQQYSKDISTKLFIVTEHPKKIFVDLVKYIYTQLNVDNASSSIHPTALINANAKIGKNVSIGAYSVIGECSIGDNSIIHDYVKIYANVSIGNNCIIREHCSIGGEGFGYLKLNNDLNEYIPQIGKVLIEDNVHIFPFSNVDRGTLGKTWIKRGTVIDHYVHIGHNTTTGFNNVIAAGTVLAGGTVIGDNNFIGVKTLVKEKCVIGSNVITGMGSVILKNVPDNQIWVGNPAKFLKEKKFKGW
ncbi:MAG: hypothetical protein JNM51_13880 [Bacteroidia bacterium]|nr:hypothetical protein [Bacteroidia bacterium]